MIPLVDRLKAEYATLGKSLYRKEGFLRAICCMLSQELGCKNINEMNNVIHYITKFDPVFIHMFKED